MFPALMPMSLDKYQRGCPRPLHLEIQIWGNGGKLLKAELSPSVWQQGEPALTSVFNTLYDIPALSEMHHVTAKTKTAHQAHPHSGAMA